MISRGFSQRIIIIINLVSYQENFERKKSYFVKDKIVYDGIQPPTFFFIFQLTRDKFGFMVRLGYLGYINRQYWSKQNGDGLI